MFNSVKKDNEPVVELTPTESVIVAKSRKGNEKLTSKEVAALKKIVERVERNNN